MSHAGDVGQDLLCAGDLMLLPRLTGVAVEGVAVAVVAEQMPALDHPPGGGREPARAPAHLEEGGSDAAAVQQIEQP